jgi:spore germination protein GerM
MLIVVVAGSAALGVALYQRQHATGDVERTEAVEKEQISVFVPDEQGRLTRKVVDVQKKLTDKERADALLRELKEARCVPDRLKLYELALGKDSVLYLNLSQEFIDRNTPEREITMTYGIVNSFIESFRGVQSVQILVEGQPVYTRSGVLYMLEPLRFNRELLEE